jgi:hypothetical protein
MAGQAAPSVCSATKTAVDGPGERVMTREQGRLDRTGATHGRLDEVGVGVVTHEVLDANPVAVETGRSVPVSHSRSPDTVAPSSGNGRERATISFPPINAAQPKEPEQITR